MKRINYLKTLDTEDLAMYIYLHKEFKLGFKKLKSWLEEEVS